MLYRARKVSYDEERRGGEGEVWRPRSSGASFMGLNVCVV